MASEIIEQLRDELNQRTTNPYFFCLITALGLYNYDLFLIAFSGAEIADKLALLSERIAAITYCDLFWPATYALGVYVLIAISSFSKLGWEWINVKVGNLILRIKNTQTVSMSAHRTLLNQHESDMVKIEDLQERNRTLLSDDDSNRTKLQRITQNGVSVSIKALIDDPEVNKIMVSICKDLGQPSSAIESILSRLSIEIPKLQAHVSESGKLGPFKILWSSLGK
jgi:hypothetical protein